MVSHTVLYQGEFSISRCQWLQRLTSNVIYRKLRRTCTVNVQKAVCQVEPTGVVWYEPHVSIRFSSLLSHQREVTVSHSHTRYSSTENFSLNTSATMQCFLHNSVASHESDIFPHNENNHRDGGHVGGWPRLVQHWLSLQSQYNVWTMTCEGSSCKCYLLPQSWGQRARSDILRVTSTNVGAIPL